MNNMSNPLKGIVLAPGLNAVIAMAAYAQNAPTTLTASDAPARVSEEQLANQMVKKVYDLKVPLILHCNGDTAIDALLTSDDFARDGDYSRPWNVTALYPIVT